MGVTWLQLALAHSIGHVVVYQEGVQPINGGLHPFDEESGWKCSIGQCVEDSPWPFFDCMGVPFNHVHLLQQCSSLFQCQPGHLLDVQIVHS